MVHIDSFLSWGIIYIYAICTVLLLTAFVFNKERLLRLLPWPLTAAFLCHSVIWVMRWYRTGYFPANGEFENALSGGWFAIALTLYVFVRRRELIGLALVTVPITLLFLGYGIMKQPVVLPHDASLKSSWLVIHVAFAQLAFGAYLVASGMGLIYILKQRSAEGKMRLTVLERLPVLPVLEELMFKFVVFGFIADAIMIAAGSIWAKDLWGSYWSWDPVEVWSLCSWLVYGLTIHLRTTLGWRGKRLAWIYVFAIIGIIIAYWGVDFFVSNSQHIFGVRPA